MKKIVPRIILAGIVFLDGKILIIQRSKEDDVFPELWEVPSGKREPLESSTSALKREVKEETGLDIEPVMPTDVFEFQVEKPDEIRDATQISFIVKPIGSTEVKLSSEHQNYAWINQDGLENYNLSKETKNILQKAFQNSEYLQL
ncbi:NUDIX domain-containing protein [Candidatus Microgenomates bacterium]|nr:NUDIX domain-containing protein [Candidatus Microgenomates bacterium]